MVEYKLFFPGYKMWDYEAQLAQLEVRKLLGARPEQFGDSLVVRKKNPVPDEQLRRLTFFYLIEISNGKSRRTLSTGQGLREIASKAARLAPSIKETSAYLMRASSLVNGRKESQYATHGVHRYKGKFYPQLVKSLINYAGIAPGQTVLDPFAGSGTTLIECAIQRINAVGVDLHPLAAKITQTRIDCLKTDPNKLLSTTGEFFSSIADATTKEAADGPLFEMSPNYFESSSAEADRLSSKLFSEATLAYLQSWFAPSILNKLLELRSRIELIESRPIRDLLLLAISDILRDVSDQDPRQLRIRRRAQPLDRAPVYRMFSKTASEYVKQILAYHHTEKEHRHAFPRIEAFRGDSRKLRAFPSRLLKPGTVDLMITSPPYATALPYLDTDRLSLVFLGLIEPNQLRDLELEMIGNREIADRFRLKMEEEFLTGYRSCPLPAEVKKIIRLVMKRNHETEVGFRRRNMGALLYKYFMDMRAVLEQVHSLLRNGASSILIVGNNRTKAGSEWLEIKTIDYLCQIGETLGFKSVESIPITVTGEDLAHAKNLIRKNSILILRK